MTRDILATTGPRERKTHVPVFTGTLTLVALLYSLDRFMLAALAQPIKDDLHISDTSFGVIAGLLFATVTTLLAVPVGRIADRHNRSAVLVACIVVWSITTALCGLVTSVWQLALARAGVALGEAGAISIVHALVGAKLPPAKRASALGLIGAGISAGTMMAMIAGGWLAQHHGWRAAFVLVASPGILLAWAVPRATGLPIGEPRPAGPAGGRIPGSTGPTVADALRMLRKSRAYVLVVACAVLCAGVASTIGIWRTAFVMRSYGLSVGNAGLQLGLATGLTSIVGLMAAGHLCSRIADPNRMMRMSAAAFGLSCASYIVAFRAESATSLMLLLILPSFLGMMWYPAIYAMLQNVVPEEIRTQATTSSQIFVQLISNGLFPSVAGWASDRLAGGFGIDSLRPVLIGTALVGFGGMALMLVLDRALRRHGAGIHVRSGSDPSPVSA